MKTSSSSSSKKILQLPWGSKYPDEGSKLSSKTLTFKLASLRKSLFEAQQPKKILLLLDYNKNNGSQNIEMKKSRELCVAHHYWK